MAITGPVIGSIGSGFFANCFGGYASRRMIPACMGVGLVAIIAGNLIAFTYNYIISIMLFWITLFIGGLILPIGTGMLMLVLEPDERPQGNSLSTILYFLLGWFPSPLVYGMADSLGAGHERLGMKIIMFATVLEFCCLFLAHINMESFYVKHENTTKEDIDLQM